VVCQIGELEVLYRVIIGTSGAIFTVEQATSYAVRRVRLHAGEPAGSRSP
jgi:hypothetical protein